MCIHLYSYQKVAVLANVMIHITTRFIGSAVKDKPRYIREQFPGNNNIIEVLIAEDPEFRDLCKDYDACADALRYWIESSALESETRVDEYRTLIRELQEEIAQTISAQEPSLCD
jgi:hypothetical protein